MKNYALIKNSVVLNVHWSDLRQAKMLAAQIEGASILCVEGLPVQSGDDYINGEFWRNGVNVSGPVKAAQFLESNDAVTGGRGLEDLIDVLIAKGVIVENDIPSQLMSRINDRKAKRAEL